MNATARQRPPGPAPVTLNPLSLLAYSRRMRSGPTERIRERFERYGDIYCAPFLGRDVIVLRHPEHLHEVLVAQASKFEKPSEGLTARQLQRLLGQGLLNSNGELWRRQRRLIQPAFRRERLEEYSGLILEHTERMLDGWQDGARINASREMMELTLRIVSKALFDHRVTDETDRVATAMRVLRQSFGGIDALLPEWLPLPSRRRTLTALADMDAMIYELIDARLFARTPEGVLRHGSGRDLLSTLAAARADEVNDGEGMSRRQLRDELVTLFLAGHETTSHALSWTWHLLSIHPEVEQRLHDELTRVLQGRAPTWSDLEHLPYAEQVLSESMRLYPPAYVLARVANADSVIGGYTIKPGTDVVMWTYLTHHDARWFPDPERFDPERFSATRRKDIPQCAYVPFGAGTRTCIGKQFALMEALLILTRAAQRFRLSAAPGSSVERDMSVTLAPKGGLPMRVRAR
jgi:cytochrome P450